MDQRLNQLSVTPTVARQTPRNEFGEVLKNTLQQAGTVAGGVGGALVGALPGGAIVSAAVSSVTAMAGHGNGASSAQRAATGVNTVNTVGNTGGVSSVAAGFDPSAANAGGFNDMLRTMRDEADRSIVQQMQMQQESREYNAISNVLKVRHDSAKAAINNIR